MKCSKCGARTEQKLKVIQNKLIGKDTCIKCGYVERTQNFGEML